MKLRALLLALFCTFAQAQEVQETPNLVNMMSWQGTAYPDPSIFSLCCSGGPGVAMNTSTNTLRFSYSFSTAYQMWQINDVLPGTGIKVAGFKYSWWIDNSGSTRGTVSANVRFASNTGALLENYNYSYGPTNGLTQYSGVELFASPYAISSLGQVGLAFTGKDATFWAGYYGPRVRDASLNLLYTAGTAPPLPTPTPTPIPAVTSTTTNTVSVTPTETLITETAIVNPVVTAAIEPTTAITTTTLISSPAATQTATAVSSPATSSPAARASGPTNSAAVSMVLRNNAAQQAALQSSNLATSIQQSQQAAQQDTGNTGSNSSGSTDAVSLGMNSFSTAVRQSQDAMTQDAASPTSTRNLAAMMNSRMLTEEQDQTARAVAKESSSTQAVGVDLGTGASLTAMAVVPQGYASYSVQLIAQTPFYAPKEIYRNQRTVDNDRVRRGLSGRSDRIHQGMVDSQYNRGN